MKYKTFTKWSPYVSTGAYEVSDFTNKFFGLLSFKKVTGFKFACKLKSFVWNTKPSRSEATI